MEANQNNTVEKKDKTKYILFALIIVLVGVIVYLLVRQNPSNADSNMQASTEKEARSVILTNEEDAQKLIQRIAEEQAEPVEQGYYTMTQNSKWHFADGNAVSEDAYVANAKENTNDVYFDVFLSSDMENAIYKSPIIPLGASLRGIKLDVPLAKNTYDCVLVYHLIDDEQNTISKVNVKLTIVIES